MAADQNISENSLHLSTFPFRYPSLDTHHLWIFRLNNSIPDDQLDKEAQLVAQHHGLKLGPHVANMKYYYWAYQKKAANELLTTSLLNPHPSIMYHEPQVKKQTLFKRTVLPIPVVNNITNRLHIQDPNFKDQWHLYNSIHPISDVNVTEVWNNGITGKDITVAIVDDGLDSNALDIKDKINYASSYDFNDHQSRPDPKLDDDYHGTRCAGEVAAAKNDVCGVGVAYDARLSGIRILSGTLLVADEASAYVYGLETNDIYSCSFGPDDRGFTLQGPTLPVQEAFHKGVHEGRNGKGALYVFASGNGGVHGDNCNADGYANSIHTITIGALTDKETRPYYAEPCAAQLAVTYSGGGDYPGIFTTDKGVSNCVNSHSGTSAAAPLGAGILALVLSANKNLTYRTVMHLLVETAVPFGLEDKENGWQFNKFTQRHFSHFFGFGKMDSYRLVEAAKKRQNVGDVKEFFFSNGHKNLPINKKLQLNVEVPELTELNTLEHVLVTLTLNHPKRGWVVIDLISPNNIVSNLMTKRPSDASDNGYQQWTFTSVQHWGEPVKGNWTLVIYDLYDVKSNAMLVDWRLGLRGEINHTNSSKPGGEGNAGGSEPHVPAINSRFSFNIFFAIVIVVVAIILYMKRNTCFWPIWNRWVHRSTEYNPVELDETKGELFYNEILKENNNDENSKNSADANNALQFTSIELSSNSQLLTEIKVDK